MKNFDQIKALAAAKKIKLADVANAAGISYQQLNRIVRTQSTSLDTLEKIADALGVPLSYFLDSDGIDAQLGDNSFDGGKSNVIPLLPIEAVAGSLSGWAESVTLRDCKKIISPIPGADFAIQISGDSMEPELQNGSYVYIKRINERAFIPWGNTMVVDTENGVVVKKLFPIDGDDCSILAKSVNANYPPFKIPTDSIIGIYRVLGGSFIVSTL